MAEKKKQPLIGSSVSMDRTLTSSNYWSSLQRDEVERLRNLNLAPNSIICGSLFGA